MNLLVLIFIILITIIIILNNFIYSFIFTSVARWNKILPVASLSFYLALFHTILMRSGWEREGFFSRGNTIKSIRSPSSRLRCPAGLSSALVLPGVLRNKIPSALLFVRLSHGSGDGREDRIDSRRMAAGASQPWHGSEKFFAVRCTRFTACRLRPAPVCFRKARLPERNIFVEVSSWLVEFSVSDPARCTGKSMPADNNIRDLRTTWLTTAHSYVSLLPSDIIMSSMIMRMCLMTVGICRAPNNHRGYPFDHR